MRLEDVADRLGVNERYVRRLIAERRVPYLKIGHLIRFDPNDIEQWIAQARVATIEFGQCVPR
jgi:excisionase family DNA binding protein